MAVILSDFYGAKRNTIISHFIEYCFFNFTCYSACDFLLLFEEKKYLSGRKNGGRNVFPVGVGQNQN